MNFSITIGTPFPVWVLIDPKSLHTQYFLDEVQAVENKRMCDSLYAAHMTFDKRVGDSIPVHPR
jgi:hypothetical protein